MEPSEDAWHRMYPDTKPRSLCRAPATAGAEVPQVSRVTLSHESGRPRGDLYPKACSARWECLVPEEGHRTQRPSCMCVTTRTLLLPPACLSLLTGDPNPLPCYSASHKMRGHHEAEELSQRWKQKQDVFRGRKFSIPRRGLSPELPAAVQRRERAGL